MVGNCRLRLGEAVARWSPDMVVPPRTALDSRGLLSARVLLILRLIDSLVMPLLRWVVDSPRPVVLCRSMALELLPAVHHLVVSTVHLLIGLEGPSLGPRCCERSSPLQFLQMLLILVSLDVLLSVEVITGVLEVLSDRVSEGRLAPSLLHRSSCEPSRAGRHSTWSLSLRVLFMTVILEVLEL